MPLERILPGFALAATFIGAGMVTLAQAVFDPFAAAVERIAGGSVLIVAAVLIVRWTFRLWSETRQALREDRAAAMERERVHIQQITELTAQLTAERQLRLALEQAGVADLRAEQRSDARADARAAARRHERRREHADPAAHAEEE